jgi:hypothetical protein
MQTLFPSLLGLLLEFEHQLAQVFGNRVVLVLGPEIFGVGVLLGYLESFGSQMLGDDFNLLDHSLDKVVSWFCVLVDPWMFFDLQKRDAVFRIPSCHALKEI